jgi:hypothetical protein
MFIDPSLEGERGIDVRLFTDIGNFQYSVGIGVIQENATVTDTTGNWNRTTSGPDTNKYAPMALVQVKHSSGLFLRYSRYTHENDFYFFETDNTGATIDSKTVSLDEDRDIWMLGYSHTFSF